MLRIKNGVLMNVTNSDIPSDGKFVIPKETTKIGSYAFEKCTALTSVKIPDNVVSMGKDVFRGCPLLA